MGVGALVSFASGGAGAGLILGGLVVYLGGAILYELHNCDDIG